MRGIKAKRLRREAKERGDFKSKRLFAPVTLNIKGVETYFPRRQRRLMMRKFMTDIKKGRIDLNKILQEKQEAEERAQNDRTKQRQTL